MLEHPLPATLVLCMEPRKLIWSVLMDAFGSQHLYILRSLAACVGIEYMPVFTPAMASLNLFSKSGSTVLDC